MNASTLLDFFNHLGKSPTEASTNGVGSSGGRFTNGISAGAIDRVTVKEEPLSEEDLRALQKDRQKKDNHNMSMHFFLKKKKKKDSSYVTFLEIMNGILSRDGRNSFVFYIGKNR